jgi:hypothetical protein
VALCKTCETFIGELICVVKLRDGVRNTGLCNFSTLMDLCCQM